jgi:hypothetical protein
VDFSFLYEIKANEKPSKIGINYTRQTYILNGEINWESEVIWVDGDSAQWEIWLTPAFV